MSRTWTGATLLGVAIVVLFGGAAASAATDPSVPDTSTPGMTAIETAEPDPTVETSEPTAPETYTLSVEIADIDPPFGPSGIRVAVVVAGTFHDDPVYVAGPQPCATFANCASFGLPPGEYDLIAEVVQFPDVAYGLVVEAGSDADQYDITLVDRDITIRFGMVGSIAPPTPPPTLAPSTTVTVAAGGPVPVAELPETGNTGRLGVASLVLIGIGAGCVLAARRRPV